MAAVAVAAPVLEHSGGHALRGVVRGVGRTAAYVEADGFVVAVTGRGVPLMPNGIAVAEQPSRVAWPPPGTAVVLGSGLPSARDRVVVWPEDAPPVWDPTFRMVAPVSPARIAGRCAAILRARGIAQPPDPAGVAALLAAAGLESAGHPGGALGIELLMRSIAERDAELTARAARLLVGLGPGLTPEGDDLLAGAAVVVAAAGEPAGWTGSDRASFRAAVCPADLHRRTTALSATLLALAGDAKVVEPVHGLLDLTSAGEARWRGALLRLEQIGHSTGPAYAAAIGVAGLLLAG